MPDRHVEQLHSTERRDRMKLTSGVIAVLLALLLSTPASADEFVIHHICRTCSGGECHPFHMGNHSDCGTTTAANHPCGNILENASNGEVKQDSRTNVTTCGASTAMASTKCLGGSIIRQGSVTVPSGYLVRASASPWTGIQFQIWQDGGAETILGTCKCDGSSSGAATCTTHNNITTLATCLRDIL